jgi:hypothetical protein
MTAAECCIVPQDIAIVPFLVLLPLIESNGGMEGASADTLLQVRLSSGGCGSVQWVDLVTQPGAEGSGSAGSFLSNALLCLALVSFFVNSASDSRLHRR